MQEYSLDKDMYYRDEYIQLYLKGDDEVFSFEYSEDNHKFINKTIKRPIKNILSQQVSGEYFDLESAYGYGGYYCTSDDQSFICRAFNKYKEKCIQENIIAEFVRFHPFNDFPVKHANLLDFNLYDRDIAVLSLEGDILKGYKPRVRNKVRRSFEKLTFQKSVNIRLFVELYSLTMRKNHADEFYFFDKCFFQHLYELENVELYEVRHENNVVAMGVFMFGGDLAHYHLSANTDDSYRLNANYFLLHNVFLAAQKKGVSAFVLGGGTTSKEDDPLLRFKKNFSNQFRPFYISGNIYNKSIYDEYNDIWTEESKRDVKYFLKYRQGII